MRRSTILLARPIRTLTEQSANARPAAVCWKCRTAMLPTSPQTARQQRFSTSRPQRAESIKPETLYDFFPQSLPTGPPPQGPFAIDIKQLRREFLQLQASAHPDRHPTSMKTRAEALSARINDAYKTLQDPLLRAQYILSLRGIELAEDETAKVDDQELLMVVLEAQEAIEEATEEKELLPLSELNQERLEESVATLERAFEVDDIDTAKKEAPGKPITLVH